MSQGTVKWFSNESDYGFVRPDDGGQNVHVRRGYMVGDGAESLKKGDRVTYDISQDAKGLWATNVSKEERRSSVTIRGGVIALSDTRARRPATNTTHALMKAKGL